jgi:hypothetical protein
MARKLFKPKRSDFAVEIKTFEGKEATYLVMKTKGAYHVFVEVEAKDAARDCDLTFKKGNTRRIWNKLWAKP